MRVPILEEFDNGEKSFDVEPHIKGEWYGKLRSYEIYFMDKSKIT